MSIVADELPGERDDIDRELLCEKRSGAITSSYYYLLLLLFSHLLTRCLINPTITKYIYIQIKMVAFH